MKKLSKILKTLMADQGLSETELSRRTKIGQPVIHRIASGETDNPKIATLGPIADYFKVSISELIGDEPLPTDMLKGRYGQRLEKWAKLPLLSWEQAIHWSTNAQSIQPMASVASDARVGSKAFALQMDNTSMRPHFPEGTILIIEPERRPVSGDFAVVQTENSQRARFKQILIDGDKILLKALNSDFSMMKSNSNTRFLGVLVQAKCLQNPLTTSG